MTEQENWAEAAFRGWMGLVLRTTATQKSLPECVSKHGL